MHKESIQTVFAAILTNHEREFLRYSIEEGFFVLTDLKTGRVYIMDSKNKETIYQAMLLCNLEKIQTSMHPQKLLKYIMRI